MEVNEAKKVLLAAPLNPTERIALNVLLAELDIEDLPDEIWRDIKDFAGYYQISTKGRIKSFHRGKITILNQQITHDGYLRIELRRPGKIRRCGIHIIVTETFLLNPNNLPEVNHEDGVKSNNCVENLKWVTKSENRRHAIEMGLVKSGCDDPDAVLTAEQVREIRRDCIPRNSEFGFCAFARKFNVSKTTVSEVYYRKRYRNVV